MGSGRRIQGLYRDRESGANRLLFDLVGLVRVPDRQALRGFLNACSNGFS